MKYKELLNINIISKRALHLRPECHGCGGYINTHLLLIHGGVSTIEVHPSFFWGSSLKELHTSPENWCQQKSKYIPMNNPIVQVYENVLFRHKIGIPTILGWKKKRYSEKKISGSVVPLA